MKKEEISNLKFLIELVKDVEETLESVLPVDANGGYTHNAMVALSKLGHIKWQLVKSWENEKLEIKDYTE